MICMLAILITQSLAMLRSRSGHDNDGQAPDWLQKIADSAKHRAIADQTSTDLSDLELLTPLVGAHKAGDDMATPPTNPTESQLFANSDKQLRPGKGPEWLRTRFPSLASEQSAPSPAPTPLHLDSSIEGKAQPAVAANLADQLLESLARTPSVAPMDNKKVVWVTAYPRSGSSSILAMISPPKRKDWKTFTAFEPCVGRGSPWKKLMKEGCQSEVLRLTRCDYIGIDHIGAKESFDNLVLYDADLVDAPSLSGAQAAAACAASDVVAFKTITYAHDVSEVLPLLQQDERIRILDVVRDPRGIYASWLSTDPFRGLVTGEHKPYWRRHDRGWFSNLTGICDQFQKNLHTPHPQVRRILFENLIKDPESVAKNNYEWLGLPFDDAAKSWIHANFDGDCSKETPFSTCRGNSSASLLKWKDILPQEEQDAFAAHPACREIATFYGYPL